MSSFWIIEDLQSQVDELEKEIEAMRKDIKECLAEAALTGEVYLKRLAKHLPEESK